MLADLVDLVLPQCCLGCGAGGAGVCADCLDVRPAMRFVPGLGPVHAAASYGGAVRAAIVHYKDRRRRDLRAVLAALLSSAVAAARADLGTATGTGTGTGIGTGVPLLVPVPSTARAARARGGDHMRRLAASVARQQGVSTLALLRVDRPMDDATGLGVSARAANVSGAFVCRYPAPASRAGPVLLIDDVITTGASLREAARSLRAAGYRVPGAAVIALVPPPERAKNGRQPRGSGRDMR